MLSNKFRKSLVVESALLVGVICIILLICCPGVWSPLFDRLDQESSVATGSVIDLLEQADQRQEEQPSQADVLAYDQSFEPGVFEVDPVQANDLEEYVPLMTDEPEGETADSGLIMLDEEPESAVRFSGLPRSPLNEDDASVNELSTNQMPNDGAITQDVDVALARNDLSESSYGKPLNPGLFQSNTFVVEKDQSIAEARGESARSASSAAFSDSKQGTEKNWRSNPWVDQRKPDHNAGETLERNRIEVPVHRGELNSRKGGQGHGLGRQTPLSVRQEPSVVNSPGPKGFVKNRFVNAPYASERRVAEQRVQSERPPILPAANSLHSSETAENSVLEPESILWDSEIQR